MASLICFLGLRVVLFYAHFGGKKNSFIDKNLLLVVGSIRNVLLCVKNFLPQDVGYGADECAEGAW